MSPVRQLTKQPQACFVSKNERLEVPQNLTDFYPEPIEFLMEQRLWQNYLKSRKSQNYSLLIDCSTNCGFSFNPHNGQIKEEFSSKNIPPERTGALLLFFPDQESKPEELIPELLSRFNFSRQAIVFVFEKKFPGQKISEETKKRKAKLLRSLGLVDIKILTHPSRINQNFNHRFIVWRARFPKERQARKPINLPEEGSDRVRGYIQYLLAKNKREYERAGFSVDDTLIREALRRSSFPPDIISRLKLGFGYTLTNLENGKIIQITLDGDESTLYEDFD